MKVEQLKLQHFRNYDELKLDFSPHVNVFIGDNAQGKTNIVEAIYVLAMTRSHRTNKDKELIQWDQDQALIQGLIKNDRQQFSLELILSKKGKIAKLNHLEQTKLSDYIGHLNVIMFAPEDLDIVKGSPSIRRKFIDMELGQMSPLYLHFLTEYNQILKQRNSYLKQGSKIDLVYFDILTDQLAQAGARVMKERICFINQLEKWSAAIHKKISQDKESLSLSYQPSIKLTSLENKEDEGSIYERFKEELEKSQDREIYQGVTLLGPHRDDLAFYINDRDVQSFASQGQQRTTALSVRLAEIDLIREMTGEYPVLLLDDVLSELDEQRQTHLLKAIESKVQTFLTTTSLDGIQKDLIGSPQLFHIHNGQIIKE